MSSGVRTQLGAKQVAEETDESSLGKDGENLIIAKLEYTKFIISSWFGSH